MISAIGISDDLLGTMSASVEVKMRNVSRIAPKEKTANSIAIILLTFIVKYKDT